MPNKIPYLRLLKIEDRGAGLAAVFYSPHGHGQFCLNRESLITRIRNLSRDGHDTSVEQDALVAIDKQKGKTDA